MPTYLMNTPERDGRNAPKLKPSFTTFSTDRRALVLQEAQMLWSFPGNLVCLHTRNGHSELQYICTVEDAGVCTSRCTRPHVKMFCNVWQLWIVLGSFFLLALVNSIKEHPLLSNSDYWLSARECNPSWSNLVSSLVSKHEILGGGVGVCIWHWFCKSIER